ncbi:MAG: hypothetical protein ACXAC6_12390 [Candidatus Hodarchaeales archaeon]
MPSLAFGSFLSSFSLKEKNQEGVISWHYLFSYFSHVFGDKWAQSTDAEDDKGGSHTTWQIKHAMDWATNGLNPWYKIIS